MADIDNTAASSFDLSKDLEKILEQQEIIKEMRADLRDIVASHPLHQEVEEGKKDLKKKRDELNADPEIDRMKEEIANANDRLKLLKEILVARMQEVEETKVSSRGKEAVVVNNVKIQKAGRG